MLKKKIIPLFIGLLISQTALAATVTSTFQVTSTLNESCVISADNVSLGTFSPQPQGEISIGSNVSVTCNSGTIYILSLSTGLGSPSYNNRRLYGTVEGSSDYLRYNIYKENGAIWGDGSTASETISGVGTGQSQSMPFFVKSPLNQYIVADIYASTLTVTVTY